MGNSSSEYIDLPELCWQIQTSHSFNGSYSQETNSTLREIAVPEVVKPSSILDEIFTRGLNITPKNVTLGVVLDEFEGFTEWYFITIVAAVGLASNLAIMVLMGRDKAMRRMAHILQLILLSVEQLYLASVIIFIQFRHFFFHDPYRQLHIMSTISTVMSLTQCLSVWLLYIVATDAYCAIRLHQKPVKIARILQVRYLIPITLAGSVLYHVPFLPDIRILIYKLNPSAFNPCNIPVEDHWDFATPSGGHDLYYILYFTLLYSFVLFIIPFFLIAARDKNIIDLLHETMNFSTLKKPQLVHTCYTAKVVSIFCNVHLICITPKLVLLLFRIADFASNFIGEAQVFFVFFSVVANLMMVFKSSVYLFLFLIFHPGLKVIILAAGCKRCRSGQRSRDEGQALPLVAVTESSEA